MGEGVVPGVVASLVSVGLYVVFRFFPETGAYRLRASPYPIGKEATVLEVDQQLGGEALGGRVRVLGETWRARLHTATAGIGDTLRVIDGDGITLICVPLDIGTIHGVSAVPRAPALILGELGRPVAGLLCVFLSAISLLVLTALPGSVGLAVFGLLAPFSTALALIAVGSSSRAPGLTVRRLRCVIAATCGCATFLGMTFGLAAAIAPAISAVVLAAFDPSLSAIFLAVGGISDA